MNPTLNDIVVGARYGRWTVLRQAIHKRYGTLPWVCVCDCGHEGLVERRKLLNGKSVKCGRCAGDARNASLQAGNLRKTLHTVDAVARKRIFTDVRGGAKRRNLLFALSVEEVEQLTTSPCFYCGRPPSNEWKVRRRGTVEVFMYSGVDRIDSLVGYVTGNVVACCAACNRAKSNQMTQQEFLNYLVRAGEHAKKTLDALHQH